MKRGTPYRDRIEAGAALARLLRAYRGRDTLVLGIPRGGVVAAEIARLLEAELDVVVARKLGAPGQPELGIGAVTSDGGQYLNEEMMRELQISPLYLEATTSVELAEARRRATWLRSLRPPAPITGRTVIVVDDGLATGATMLAAARALRRQRPARLIVAVPVGSRDACDALRSEVDKVVCPVQPVDSRMPSTIPDLPANHVPEAVHIPIGLTHSVPGTLALPPYPSGLVLFAHGSGSSRFSRRNRYVADRLFDANLGWLLFDLLTDHESRSRDNVFDISLLAERLQLATEWAAEYPATRDLVPGYFGASTGAAAALMAASGTTRVRAVVSRGGRPDLASEWLPRVTVPTLLIVGGADHDVLELNARALQRLGGVRELLVVPRATHLFQEPGTLERVAAEAARWFGRYLPAGAGTPPRSAMPSGT